MHFHPYAEIFPLIQGSEFDELVADIKSFGLREKIVLFDGKVLDGRNRYLACQKAKVKPQFKNFRGTEKGALALVISSNVHRRHLTESQRAMAAAKVATLHQGARTDLNLAPIGAKSQAGAATDLKVSRRSVQRAKKVIEQGSEDLQHAVETGEIAVAKAATVVELPKEEQLGAARAKPLPKVVLAPVPAAADDLDEPEDPGVDDEEMAKLAETETQYAKSIDTVMQADDKLAAAHEEIKRQAAEIANLKLTNNGLLNRQGELVRKIKGYQRQIKALEKKLGIEEDQGVERPAVSH